MQKINIETLPEAVKKNLITKQEAAKIVWEEIYTHPHQYGLINFTEDQKSDLLLGIHKNFERFFDKFIPGTITFKTFLTGCLAKYKSSFLRDQFTRENERRTIDTYLLTKIEEDSHKYELKIAETNHDTQFSSGKTLEDIIKKHGYSEKNKRIAALTVILLMMKSCNDTDDETINSVSSFTGIDKSILYDKIEVLKDSISRKNKNSLKLLKRRNNAFFFHRKYMQEMLETHFNEKRMEKLKRKYEIQTKKWKEKNQTLSARSDTPSNEEIAKLIGMKPRTVSFYINQAREYKNLSKIRKTYEDETEKKLTEKDFKEE